MEQNTSTKVSPKNFWYIATQCKELVPNKVLGRRILNEHIALYRDKDGKAVAVQDHCLHRAAKLSKGSVKDGHLTCPYHGWTYDGEGAVVAIPSEGPGCPKGPRRCLKTFQTREYQGYVFVCLDESQEHKFDPFPIPQYGEKGWHHIRLINHFKNNVTNCAENFVDIPHTAYVHPGIFRKTKHQKLQAQIVREGGEVHVRYNNETANLGWFSKFLNPSGEPIQHRDSFYMPNVTSVEYNMGRNRHLFITSQSIPETDDETLVYTDLTYNYGIWTRLSAPVLRYTAQKIIDQDVEILGDQMQSIKTNGAQFQNSPADLIHVYIESIQNSLKKEEDPRRLPLKQTQIEFWV